MPSIFLLGGFFQCGSTNWKLPRHIRNKRKSSSSSSVKLRAKSSSSRPEEAKTTKQQHVVVVVDKNTKDCSNGMIATVLSGNLTDSTDSMFSQSSCDSYMTAMTSERNAAQRNDTLAGGYAFGAGACAGACAGAGASASAGGAIVEVSTIPAESFYFLPMEEDEFSDLQCTVTSDSDYGYFVDFAG